jgi:signal transduction histidine kinase
VASRSKSLVKAESEVEVLQFTVASALLRELGERLVGQAHIALAELIKNSYDADATVVELTVDEDEIVISDNGHGMSREDFTSFWMRIGSPHKEEWETSPNGRPLTGSKGVGRLAAQFLAHELELQTSAGQGHELLEAEVNWDQAVDAGELTEATATVERSRRKGDFPGRSWHGTRLVLRDLKEDWDAEALEQLARELWPLRPPFRASGDQVSAFDIQLSSSLEGAEESFEEQMEAILDLYDARITGQLIPLDEDPEGRPGGRRTVRISVELGGRTHTYSHVLERCKLEALDYQIRVFDLQRRQPAGIRVGLAREYLNRFGGVHVYDAGFHLPYYGPEADWLSIEQEHSHRVTKSKLLPEDLHVPGALTFLPTNSRLWGVVNVNTSRERAAVDAREVSDRNALTIQVTRDRLVDNLAYKSLVKAVRVGLDFYAIEEAKKHAEEMARLKPAEPVSAKAQRVEEVLERHREEIPPPVFRELKQQITEVVEGAEAESEALAGQAGLLGALATAGIGAIAFEHEFNRSLDSLDRAAKRLGAAAKRGDLAAVEELASEVSGNIDEARQMRQLFGSVMDAEDRTRRTSPRARPVLEDVFAGLGAFVSGVELDLEPLDGELRLPPGTQAEWSALWQNLMINAINAMADSPEKTLRASNSRRGSTYAITLENTGAAVDLDSAEELFQPFARTTELASDGGLGFGGTGLGLTIVRMLAETLGCTVRFVPPSEEYSTAVRLAWSDK